MSDKIEESENKNKSPNSITSLFHEPGILGILALICAILAWVAFSQNPFTFSDFLIGATFVILMTVFLPLSTRLYAKRKLAERKKELLTNQTSNDGSTVYGSTPAKRKRVFHGSKTGLVLFMAGISLLASSLELSSYPDGFGYTSSLSPNPYSGVAPIVALLGIFVLSGAIISFVRAYK